MRKLLYFTAVNLTLACFFQLSYATPVARVISVSGEAFLLKGSENHRLKVGDHIHAFNQVLTSEETSVSFLNYFQQTFTLSELSHLEFFPQNYKLKRGRIWGQSYEATDSVSIQTVSAKVKFSDGDFILSYQTPKQKTELFVMGQAMFLENTLGESVPQEVLSGQFSFVQTTSEQIAPRSATLLSYASYRALIERFPNKSPLDELSLKEVLMASGSKMKRQERKYSKEIGRKPASVRKGKNKEGKILFLSSLKKNKGRTPASVPKRTAAPMNVAKIRIFGSGKKLSPKSAPTLKVLPSLYRIPSSVKSELKKTKKSRGHFQKSLEREYQKQQRHDDTTNDLLHELQSVKKDYKVYY